MDCQELQRDVTFATIRAWKLFLRCFLNTYGNGEGGDRNPRRLRERELHLALHWRHQTNSKHWFTASIHRHSWLRHRSGKQSANEQVFDDAQTAVGLLQTTRIISDVFFFNTQWPRCLRQHKWNQNRLNRDGTLLLFFLFFFFFFFTRGRCVSCLRGCMGFHRLIHTQTFRRALSASVDSCAEIKSAPSVAQPILAEFGRRCRKAMLGVWPPDWLPH